MVQPKDSNNAPSERMRLDKWLWAARFFKTRQIAAEAVQGGKVHLNGQRCKPGKDVRVGSQLSISKGPFDWEIEILVLPKQRRPASEAKDFYQESESSHEKRQKLTAQIRAENASRPQPDHKPNKRERRLIHRFKQVDS
jgi:ribosome-associated heat shock protein Hsp15